MLRLLTLATCGWLLGLLGAATSVSAHPIPFSYLDLRVQTGVIEMTLVAHVVDIGHELKVAPPERLVDPVEASRRAEAFAALATSRVQVTVDGRPLTAEWSEGAEVLAERQSIRIRGHYELEGRPGSISVTAAMFPYDPQHQTFLNLYDGDSLEQSILDKNHRSYEHFAGSRQGKWAVLKKFVPSGVNHILNGPQHLLFLFGLLLLGGTVRQLALVVGAFTVAHSLALLLAGLNLVTPPPRVIEPAIALSVVYVGTDNLLVQGGRDLRAWIALGFGLIHGFGFANVLRAMDLPSRAVGWSVFSFSLGIEIGQVLIVALAASVLAFLRSRSESAGRRLAFAGSLVVIIAGTFWFVERVFFAGGM
jgi:hydrogenase/urease accessory protein HupE